MDSVEIIYKDSMRPDSSDEAGHELAAHFASETAATDHTVAPHSDLYEQIDQLAAIDIDEIIKLQADDANVVTTHPVLYADFFEGLAQLATMGVVEVTEIVEAIHREVIYALWDGLMKTTLTIGNRYHGTEKPACCAVLLGATIWPRCWVSIKP